MAWLKFSADNIFTGTDLLGIDKVLITDENGIVENIIDRKYAGDNVSFHQGILSPGFINCHCHLELSHMKGLIPEKTGLIDFVFKVVTQRHFAEDEILDAITKAEDEMLTNGIVAVGDICNNTLTLPQKLKQRLAYYNFIEVSGWLPEIAETRFARSKGFYDEFFNSQWLMVNSVNNQQPTSNNALVPHAPYSVSGELWKLIRPSFKDKSITIHNQETSFEDELFEKGSGDFLRMYQMMKLDSSFFKPSGKSSLQSYYEKLTNAQNIILVHNTYTKEEDIFFVNKQSSQTGLSEKQPNTYFCICINANLYIENKVPPVDLLLKNNCDIVLGTDSLASNWSLNLLSEMKNIQKHFPQVTPEKLLQWATINGAKALQMESTLGSFEKGKTPGVNCIAADFSKVDKLI